MEREGIIPTVARVGKQSSKSKPSGKTVYPEPQPLEESNAKTNTSFATLLRKEEDPKEGYDVIRKEISKLAFLTRSMLTSLSLLDKNGEYEMSFPLKRYQSLLPPQDDYEPKKNITCLAVLYPPTESDLKAILITGSDDKFVRVWDAYETKFLLKYKCVESVSAVAVYNPSRGNEYIGQKVVVCGGSSHGTNAFALLLNLDSIIAGNGSPMNAEALIPLGSSYHEKYVSSILIHEPYDREADTYEKPIVVIASADRSITVWDLAEKELIFKLPTGHTDLLLSVAVHDPGCGREGLHLITGSWDKTVLFFDVGMATPTEDVTTIHESDSQREMSTIKERTLSTHYYHKLRGHTKSVTTIAAYNLHGNQDMSQGSFCSVLVTGSLDKTVIIWDIESKEKVRTLRGHEGKITAVLIYESISGSPPIVITGAEDGKSILWDLLSGEKIRELSFPEKVLCQTIVRNDSGLIVVTGRTNKKVTITNLGSFDRIRNLERIGG